MVHICGDPSLRKTLVTPQVLKKEREIVAVSIFLGGIHELGKRKIGRARKGVSRSLEGMSGCL